jgi:hypothetical protein
MILTLFIDHWHDVLVGSIVGMFDMLLNILLGSHPSRTCPFLLQLQAVLPKPNLALLSPPLLTPHPALSTRQSWHPESRSHSIPNPPRAWTYTARRRVHRALRYCQARWRGPVRDVEKR